MEARFKAWEAEVLEHFAIVKEQTIYLKQRSSLQVYFLITRTHAHPMCMHEKLCMSCMLSINV